VGGQRHDRLQLLTAGDDVRNGDLPPGVAFVNRRSSEKLFAMRRWAV
jgi:hypothetical protein